MKQSLYLWGEKTSCRCTSYLHILNPFCCVETFRCSMGEYINLLQWLSREGNLQYLHANKSLQYYSPLCDSADCQAVKAWHFLFIHQVTHSHGNHLDRHVHPSWQDELYEVAMLSGLGETCHVKERKNILLMSIHDAATAWLPYFRVFPYMTHKSKLGWNLLCDARKPFAHRLMYSEGLKLAQCSFFRNNVTVNAC